MWTLDTNSYPQSLSIMYVAWLPQKRCYDSFSYKFITGHELQVVHCLARITLSTKYMLKNLLSSGFLIKINEGFCWDFFAAIVLFYFPLFLKKR